MYLRNKRKKKKNIFFFAVKKRKMEEAFEEGVSVEVSHKVGHVHIPKVNIDGIKEFLAKKEEWFEADLKMLSSHPSEDKETWKAVSLNAEKPEMDVYSRPDPQGDPNNLVKKKEKEKEKPLVLFSAKPPLFAVLLLERSRGGHSGGGGSKVVWSLGRRIPKLDQGAEGHAPAV
jgi:hypothetical protein